MTARGGGVNPRWVTSPVQGGRCRLSDGFYGEGASEGHVERELQSLHSAWPGGARLQGRVVPILETTHQTNVGESGVRAGSCPGSLGKRCPPGGAPGHYGLIHFQGVSKGEGRAVRGRQWETVTGRSGLEPGQLAGLS